MKAPREVWIEKVLADVSGVIPASADRDRVHAGPYLSVEVTAEGAVFGTFWRAFEAILTAYRLGDGDRAEVLVVVVDAAKRTTYSLPCVAQEVVEFASQDVLLLRGVIGTAYRGEPGGGGS